MTPEQKADMEYFAKMMKQEDGIQKVYALSSDSTLDGALDKSLSLQGTLQELSDQKTIQDYSSCNQFITSKKEQARRLQLWQKFLDKHQHLLTSGIKPYMTEEGFADSCFADFEHILHQDYQQQDIQHFKPLLQSAFASNISTDSLNGKYHVINILSAKEKDVKKVEDCLQAQHSFSFDVKSMNSAIANHLSDDFNYIGFACGFIVFFFLWLSMGSIELAILSFIPMVISWLWILGLMAIFHMQFNIVNIILATFIFGQGDDYTIFMTEGAMYEYAYRRKMLASYKHSIIISALIMFIGIGTLIVARHPALRSLAEVTIAGMFSVVLMAYIFPPLIFNWLVKHKGEYRVRPLSLQMLFRRRKEGVAYYHDLVLDRYRYKGVEVFSTVKRNLRRNRDYQAWMEQQDTSLPVIIPSAGYGEKALLFALLHPETKVIAVEADPDKCRLMKFSMEGIVENVEIINQAEISRQM